MSAQKYIIPALLLLTVLLIYRNLYFTMPDPTSIKQTIISAEQRAIPEQAIATDYTTTNEETHEIAPKKFIRNSLTIENHITKKMLTYKYFVSYNPTKFDLYANNVHLVTLDDKQRPVSTQLNKVPIKDNKLMVRYSYEFMNGSRKGAKEVVFEVSPDINTLNLTFSWKNKWRVILDNAVPVSVERIEK